MSVEELFDQAKRDKKQVYFWTFTWPLAMSYWCYTRSWRKFTDLLWKQYTSEEFAGLRIWERHPVHGGLHVHMLCNERLYVGLMRRLARHCGLGFVLHVRKARADDGQYMAKYMTKDGSIDGMRMWGKLGNWEHIKCGDLEFQSKEADKFRFVNGILRARGMSAAEAYNMTRVELSRDNSRIEGVTV